MFDLAQSFIYLTGTVGLLVNGTHVIPPIFIIKKLWQNIRANQLKGPTTLRPCFLLITQKPPINGKYDTWSDLEPNSTPLWSIS